MHGIIKDKERGAYVKVILMNKNTQVLLAEYMENVAVFSQVYQVLNIEFAPVIINKTYDANENLEQALTDWFRGRGIPEGRDKLDMLMDKLNISSPTALLDKAFGLSLSDQYWICPYDEDIKYDDINFFDNDFNDLEFTEATFSNNASMSSEITFITPNNTTDGVLRKTWIIENGKRYLLKAGLKSEVLQPFNEVLASMICDRLGFNHVTYTLDNIKGNIVSKCPCFINSNTELISAYQVLRDIKTKYVSISNTENVKFANQPKASLALEYADFAVPSLSKIKDNVDDLNKEQAYENYIQILSNHGIENVKEKVDNMFILDYLMLNNDRHLNNFGVIRDVNTLEWLDVAPIFDTGNSLNLLDYTDDEIIIEGNGRFFYNVDSFDNIIKKISDLKRIDVSKLEGVVEEFDELLHKYQDITKMSERRIHRLCVILNRQINKLKALTKQAE